MTTTGVVCNICLEDKIENPVFTPCIHGFCNKCISSWINEKKRFARIPCPVCKSDIAELAGDRDEDDLYMDDEPIPQSIRVIPLMFTSVESFINPEPTVDYRRRGVGIEELIINQARRPSNVLPFGRSSDAITEPAADSAPLNPLLELVIQRLEAMPNRQTAPGPRAQRRS